MASDALDKAIEALEMAEKNAALPALSPVRMASFVIDHAGMMNALHDLINEHKHLLVLVKDLSSSYSHTIQSMSPVKKEWLEGTFPRLRQKLAIVSEYIKNCES